MATKKTATKTHKKGTAPKTKAKAKAKAKPETSGKRTKLSGLDAAAQVLAEAAEPLDTKTMVERMLAKDLWQTKGKTPAATIYAAIIREIGRLGPKARFRKARLPDGQVGRGKFELAK